MGRCTYLDPPKSPPPPSPPQGGKGDFEKNLVPLLLRGLRGDRNSMQPHKKLVLLAACTYLLADLPLPLPLPAATSRGGADARSATTFDELKFEAEPLTFPANSTIGLVVI